jgi:serine phosphatase RsbU (regulator of sigma subunit)
MLPIILGLVIVGVFSYKHTQTILQLHNKIEDEFIEDEILLSLERQFVSLSLVNELIDVDLESCSNILIDMYDTGKSKLLKIDISSIKQTFCTDSNFNITIIDKKGVIVKTTIDIEQGVNVFKRDNKYKKDVEKAFETSENIISGLFAEDKPDSYVRYCCKSTEDKEYVILISRSNNIDKIFNHTISSLRRVCKKEDNTLSVNMLFVISGKAYLMDSNRFVEKQNLNIDDIKTDKKFITENDKISDTYFYISNGNANTIEGCLVNVKKDKIVQQRSVRVEKIKVLITFVVLLVIIYLLIFLRINRVVLPIKSLINQTKKIANGNYLGKVKVEGSNELAILSDNFNKMLDSIKERNEKIEEQSDFLYNSNRKLNEAYKLLAHQKKLIESKQYDLTDSINYALHIQESLMPKPDSFAEVFEDSFVYILPCNIVSGDFYWFSKHRNKLVINLSDCTGHGVPGAFMSMIGITILNHLVNYEHIYDPALILSHLDAEICNLLIYNNPKEQRFEGMDSAICTIDFDTDELVFSSAKRPIILIRDGEVITYKGSIYPIGEYYDAVQKVFTNKTIKLQEGDIIYMFSDGYTSQFNDDNKKFNTRRFNQLLKDISYKPVKEHPAIINRTFEAWKGDTEQIDDILILAFRYTKDQIHKTISAKDLINL